MTLVSHFLKLSGSAALLCAEGCLPLVGEKGLQNCCVCGQEQKTPASSACVRCQI
jgi:hypothetical protein